MRCPRCTRAIVRLAPQRGLSERLAGVLTIYPHRCQLCGHRFLRFRGRLASLPRRTFHRVRVSFPALLRSAFYRTDIAPQRSTVTDLSIGGCRLDRGMQLSEGSRLRLELMTAGEEPPVVVDEAVVRSRPDGGVGMAFTQVRRTERRRIARIIRDRLGALIPDDSSTPSISR